MTIKDSLGNRMKSYENCYRYKLPIKTHLIIRVDGKSFHTFTKKCQKPFDDKLINCMNKTGLYLLKEIQNAKIVYIQSDEISIYTTDTKSEETQGFFDNNYNKIISISSSMTTMYFNSIFNKNTAMFDSRVFIIPKEDIGNYFIWRQRDWNRNSLSMFARKFFSVKELHKKTQTDMHEMLYNIGENWSNLNDRYKNGRFYYKDENGDIQICDKKVIYEEIQKWLN